MAMTGQTPNLEGIIKSLRELKQLVDEHDLQEIADLIDAALEAAEDAAGRAFDLSLDEFKRGTEAMGTSPQSGLSSFELVGSLGSDGEFGRFGLPN